MKILSIELYGYNRFSLNSINYFKATFTEIIQLVIGSNGSGKSSLLEELTPLPSDSKNYSKDGYKIIKIEKNKSLFTLKTQFGKSPQNSFLINDEEFNNSGTASIQKELVKQYFNITPEIHNLLLGNIKFHSMSPNDRRQWFTKLADTDYQYAISVYQRLKEKHRDLIGSIKLNNSRLIQESQKIIDKDKEAIIKQKIVSLESNLSDLLKQKSPLAYKSNDIINELEELELQIKENSDKLRQFINSLGYLDDLKNLDEFKTKLAELRFEENHIQNQINKLTEEISKDEKTVNLLDKAHISGIEEIDQKIKDCLSSLRNLTDKIKIKVDLENLDTCIYSIGTIKESLFETLTSIPTNTENKFTKTRYDALINQDKLLETKSNELEIKYKTFTSELNLLKKDLENHSIECPNCHHVFYKVYNQNKHDAIEKEINTITNNRAILSNKINLVKEEIESIKDYMSKYKYIVEVIKQSPQLNPFWKYIKSINVLNENPSNLLNLISDLESDLNIKKEIERINGYHKELLFLKESNEQNDKSNINILQDKINVNNTTIFKANERLISIKNKITNLIKNKDILESILELEKTTSELMNSWDNNLQLYLESVEKQLINKLIDRLKTDIDKLNSSITEAFMKKAMIEKLKEQIKEDEENKLLYENLIKELSPTEGLIAKGLLGFINHFIGQMNSFISKIWLYQLEIIPCKSEDTDLDFKFPLQIKDRIVPDISKSSSAMKEIINLAFKIVAMKYLNLQDSPLYLDEFAANMDSHHRNEAFHAIKYLMTQSDFTQIFLISHYESLYGSLVNSEITVLCSNNIEIPEGSIFNKHIVME